MSERDYMLFQDGTMNILVDGKVQRRKYSIDACAIGKLEQIEPMLLKGERLMRYLDGGMEIVYIGDES